jgi:hypothetical protein
MTPARSIKTQRFCAMGSSIALKKISAQSRISFAQQPNISTGEQQLERNVPY